MVQQQVSLRGFRFRVAVLGSMFAASLAWTAMAQTCAGDCGADAAVTVDELITCVNIALGTQAVSTCVQCDSSGDGEVTIDEIVLAVTFALDACPVVTPGATASPTPTVTPAECPTPPSTPHGSIVVWPDLQVDDRHDPLVRLTNTSRMLAGASCFYADGSPRCAGSGAACTTDADCGGDTCAPVCTVASFTVRLPMLSTLAWQPRVGGRDEFDGVIPALPALPFRGELVCLEIDDAGYPLAGDHLAGTSQEAQQCPLAATAVGGLDSGNGDDMLCLGGGISDQCTTGQEYAGCPAGVDPIRIEDCWSDSRFTFDCGPSVTAPTRTPTRTPPAGSTATPTPCPPAAPGSIIVFEALNVSASSDSVLEIRNRANFRIHAQCFYAEAGASAGCTVSEFWVSLAKQSSVTWPPRLGGVDAFGNNIPAVPGLPFQGELVCVQVDEYGTPLLGNSLSGSVTTGAACAAVATGISGFPDLPSDDLVLCLGGAVSGQCPNGAEYEDCPAALDTARIEGCWSESRFSFVCG